MTGAFLFVRTFRNLLTLNAGFRQDHVLVVDFDFSPLKLPPDNQMAYKQELLARMQNIPGVSSAAETLIVPLGHSGWDNNIDIPNGPQRQDVGVQPGQPGIFPYHGDTVARGAGFQPDGYHQVTAGSHRE